MKTIANAQLRELERKMDEAQKKQCEQTLSLCKRAVNQQKNGKDTIYSLHEPFTRRIAKGKAHKQHESGNKVRMITTGRRGRKQIRGVTIISPGKPKAKDSAYQKRQKRNKCRAGAAIEPIFGHLKKDFRMEQNYLWAGKGMQINAYLAATAWNLKKMMERLKDEFLYFIFQWFFRQDKIYFSA